MTQQLRRGDRPMTAPNEVQDRFVDLGEVRLAYQVHGEGPPVLLLAGTGMPKESWLAAWVPTLVGAGRRVVVVDTRGTGASSAPAAPYSVTGLAGDVAGLIERLDLAPCALVGFSLGGIVAEELVTTRPDLVDVAVVIGAARPVTAHARLVAAGFVELAAAGVELPPATWAALMLGLMFTPDQLLDDGLVTATHDRMAALPPWRDPGRHGVYTASLAAELDDPRPRWPGIERPVLVVAFDADVESPVASARGMADTIPGAELRVVEGAGHGGVFTHVATVAGHVVDFLNRSSEQ